MCFENPKVSVIIPLHNCCTYIEATVRSVLQQTYTNFELIIVDDASTDGSYEIVKRLFSSEKRIQFVHFSKNKGVSISRNKGLEIASGRYIAFLDADDIWEKNKLETQVAFMRQTGSPICHTVYAYIDEDNRILTYSRVHSCKIFLKDIMKNTEIGLSTSMIDHLAVGDFSFSPTNSREDLSLWLSLFDNGFYSMGINEPLVYYRLRRKQRSANKIHMAFETLKVYLNFQHLSFRKKLFYYSMYAINASYKHLSLLFKKKSCHYNNFSHNKK